MLKDKLQLTLGQVEPDIQSSLEVLYKGSRRLSQNRNTNGI